MTEYLDVDGGRIAYDVTGEGPLIVLSTASGTAGRRSGSWRPSWCRPGSGWRRHMRGHGDSSMGWASISRTDVAGDLIALIRHLGGPAIIVGHSLSGGAATIAAATAPDLVKGVVEVGPFTKKVEVSLGGLFRVRRYRRGSFRWAGRSSCAA